MSIAMEKGWIACGNIFPIKSHYMWKSKATREDEYVSIVKTGLHLVQKFTAYAEAVHPYETPCVIHWTANANESYVKWIYNNVKSE